MPPKEPLIYRLYEIVANYGYAYKAVMNEKFGDGIMSAIAFSTTVDKEVDKDGVTWVNIKLRGKWYMNAIRNLVPPLTCPGCRSRDSRLRKQRTVRGPLPLTESPLPARLPCIGLGGFAKFFSSFSMFKMLVLTTCP
jgi:hypothetical protein